MIYATLEELCDSELTQNEVIGILENHSQTDEDIESFFKEEGYKDSYIGSEVLNWLGY
jgi:TusA-related sulfurtransferase